MLAQSESMVKNTKQPSTHSGRGHRPLSHSDYHKKKEDAERRVVAAEQEAVAALAHAEALAEAHARAEARVAVLTEAHARAEARAEALTRAAEEGAHDRFSVPRSWEC